MFWGNLMEQAVGVLKSEKISGGIIVMIVCSLWWLHTWASDEHENLLTKEDHNRDHVQLTAQVTELTTFFTEYVSDQKIVNAGQLVRDKELQLTIAQATGEAPDQIAHLEDEISDAEKYKHCLINKLPNCKHLKPPE